MNYGAMTVPALQAELRRRGGRQTGRKAELVARLEAYDGMDERFPSDDIRLPPPTPLQNWPEKADFKSVCFEDKDKLPTVQKPHLEQYIVTRQGPDASESFHSTADKKSRLMAEESVLALSLTEKQDIFYFSGVVAAAMKKSVTYNVKFSIKARGDILNSACDCPSGIGPHSLCKHIRASILVLIEFKASGVLGIKSACTEELQQFHRPKKMHSGSPVKASNLGKGLGEEDDDPRPLHLRNRASYTDEVFMQTVHYSQSSGTDVFLRYAFRKADIQAASLDHDFFSRPFTEY